MPISSEGRAVPEPFRADRKIGILPFAAEETPKFNTKGEDNMFITSDGRALAPCPQRAATRPLQRVEMDSCKVDLLTLIAGSGLLLSAAERHCLRLDSGKQSWHLTVAICTTTRCILAMGLSRTPTAANSAQMIDMITRDKGVWAAPVGALSPWHMFGLPEKLVTDCKRDCVSVEARVAARDLGITLKHAPAGFSELRGGIEPLLMALDVDPQPRLSGRYLSNMISHDNDDPLARSALTEVDLCAVLVRWIVDIYHSRPHAGLDGETPAQCWDRLTAQPKAAGPG